MTKSTNTTPAENLGTVRNYLHSASSYVTSGTPALESMNQTSGIGSPAPTDPGTGWSSKVNHKLGAMHRRAIRNTTQETPS